MRKFTQEPMTYSSSGISFVTSNFSALERSRNETTDELFTAEGSFNYRIRNLIKQGQNDNVKSCINDVDPSYLIDSCNTSLLHLAAEYNNCDLINYLLKIKCNIDAKNASKRTPLMVAARANSFKAAKILIEANADIYAISSSNKSSLELLLNNKIIPQYLVNCCLKRVERESSSDEVLAGILFAVKCPLHFVIRLKKPNVTKMILNHCGQLDSEQSSAAMELALKLKDQANVGVLLQCGVNITINTKNAIQFFLELCTCRPRHEINLKFINTFLERVTDWNRLEKDCLNCLQKIFRLANKEVIELLFYHGANNHVKNQFPGYDLCIDIFGNDDPDARGLLNYLIFDVNARGQDGFTALHFAVEACHLDYVQTLLKYGADPNIKNTAERVPLNFINTFTGFRIDGVMEQTFFNDQKKILELLLQTGADPQLVMERDFDLLEHINFDSYKLQLMLAQLAINESMGAPIIETVRRDIRRFPKVFTWYRTYFQELEKLKALKIHDTLTVYTILTTDALKIAKSVHDRQVIESIMLSSGVEELHHYYRSKLKNTVDQILHIMDLKMTASTYICENMGFPYTQHIIVEKILSYLTYRDLLVFD